MSGENDRSGDDGQDSTDEGPNADDEEAGEKRRPARDDTDPEVGTEPATGRRTDGSDPDGPPEKPTTGASEEANAGERGADEPEAGGAGDAADEVEDATGGTEDVTGGNDGTPPEDGDTTGTTADAGTEPVGESGRETRAAGPDSEAQAGQEPVEPVDEGDTDNGERVEDREPGSDDVDDEETSRDGVDGPGDVDSPDGVDGADGENGTDGVDDVDDDGREAEPIRLRAEVGDGEAFVDEPVTVVVRTGDDTAVEGATVETDRGQRVRTDAAGTAELTFDEAGTVEIAVGKDGEGAEYEGDGATVEVQPVDARIERLAAEVDDLEAVLDDGFERLRARRAELSSVRQSRIDELEERVATLADDNESLQERIDFLEERHERELRRTVGDLVTKFVYNVRENLATALDHESDEKRRENVRMALGEFDDVLAHQADATLVRPEPGDDLDRERHRPIGRRESDRPENAVVEVVRPGVELDGEVFEKAKVTVSEG